MGWENLRTIRGTRKYEKVASMLESFVKRKSLLPTMQRAREVRALSFVEGTRIR